MPQPLHPYFKLGRTIFISSAVIFILLESFTAMAVSKHAIDVATFLLSLTKINLVILIFGAVLMLMGLWESREMMAAKTVSKRTIKIKTLHPDDHEAFEAWLELDFAHKHLRKTAQIQNFLSYKKSQKKS